MSSPQSRRDVLSLLSFAGTAGFLGSKVTFADEPELETRSVRLSKTTAICLAPTYLVHRSKQTDQVFLEKLIQNQQPRAPSPLSSECAGARADNRLQTEGLEKSQYISTPGGLETADLVSRGEIDVRQAFAALVVSQLDAGQNITALAGLRTGCYALFGHEPLQTIADLKGKRVGIQTLSSRGHLYVSVMAKSVGLDPQNDIEWVSSPDGKAIELLAEGKVDAFLGFAPEPQDLRARKVGRVLVNTSTDKPWSQYFYCVLYGNRDFVRSHPIATKRFLQAPLKSADFCANNPAAAARTCSTEGLPTPTTTRFRPSMKFLTGRGVALMRKTRRGSMPSDSTKSGSCMQVRGSCSPKEPSGAFSMNSSVSS